MNKAFRVFKVFSVVVALIAVFAGVSADAAKFGNYLNGEQYMMLSEDERMLIVAGLFDMMSFEWGQPIYADAADAGTRAFIERVGRCVQGKSLGQLTQMLDQYLAADPKTKNYNLASSFNAMLNTQCP
jgi:hypothetical protein